MLKKFTFLILLFTAAASIQAQQTILWKVSKPGNDKVSYLLGTYHIAGSSFVEAYPIIREKLQTTNVLVTETEINRAAIAAYFEARPTSDTLSQILSDNDIQYIAQYLKGKNLSKLTPGEIYITLSANYAKFKCQDANASDTIFFDEYLQQLARNDSRQLVFLEEKQDEIFAQLTARYDWNFFKKYIGSLLKTYRSDKPDKSRCSEYQKYLHFDLNYNFSGQCSNTAGLTDRNNQWMQKIPALLDSNTCFIAVGIYHLFFKCGLITQLRNKGYTIEPVAMK